MFCPACGRRLPEEAAFCNQCGSKVPAVPSAPPLTSSGTWPQSEQTLEPIRALLPIHQVQQVSQPVVPSRLPPPAMSAPLPLPSRLQRFLIRVFQPALASNPVLGVTLGGVLAVIGGVLVATLALNAAHALMPEAMREGYAVPGEQQVDSLLGIVLLHVPFRESLQLFLVMHGVGRHIVSTTDSSTYTTSYFAPLHGLLLFPALFLTLGGYIAASTDFSRRVQTSLLRGAAIAIPYTIALLIIASQVNGSILGPNGTSSQYTPLLNMDLLTLIVFGLLWGALFGVVGASLEVAQGHWRRMLYYFLQTNPRPQLVGMITGGLAATGLGVVLSLLAVCSFVAYTSYSHPFVAGILCTNTDWQTLTLWSIVNGPLHAVNLFAFSFGAPVTINNQFVGDSSCFYAYGTHTVLGLLNANLHLPSWFYALLLIPALSLFLGGRVSAAAARVQGAGPGAVHGALIAAPFTLLMILLTLISTISFTYTDTSSSRPPVMQSAGVGAFDLLLWALLSSAVLGALGGMYQASAMKSEMSKIFAILALPVVVLCSPFFFILDRLTGQPRTAHRSRARSWLYGAFLCALLLAMGAVIAGNLLINLNRVLTYDDNQRILNIFSALLIAVPGLLLLCATASSLATNPFAQSQQLPRVSGTMPLAGFQQGV